jgi:uncharacterized membrane protein YkgB
MTRHPVLGAFTILVALVPLLFVVIFVGVHDAPLTNWFVIQRLVLFAVLVIAGALLLVGHQHGYVVALTAWTLRIIDSIAGVVVLWPAPDYWYAATQDFFYLAAGVPILVFLTHRMRQLRHGSGNGRKIAA